MTSKTVPPQERVEGYRLVAGLGHGGMARVFLAVSEKPGGFQKLFVLKVLRRELDEPEFVEMFAQEARLGARLNHANLVQTFEVGESHGAHFMAMEYLDGQALSTLHSTMDRSTIPLAIQLRVICEMLDGLDAAHELVDYDGSALGIVHRDVSPHNVFVTYDGQVKVLDFGIAKMVGTSQTRTGVMKGKAGYMAPEQVAGEPVDRRTDIFAAGVMLWEALANTAFIERGDEVGTLTRRLSGGEKRVREVAPNVSAPLAEVCDRAIALARADRFSTALAMREAIELAAGNDNLASRRQVAAFVEEHFREARAKLRSRIEEQLGRHESRPMIDLISGRVVTGVGTGSVAGSAAGAAMENGSPTGRRSRTGVVLTLAGLAAVGILGGTMVVRAMRSTVGTSRVASAAPISSSTPTPVPTPAVARDGDHTPVRVVVRTTPASAKLRVDGVETSNPFVYEGPADARVHRVVATAAGYADAARVYAFDRADEVVVHLAAREAVAKAISPSTRPIGSAPAPVPSAPGPKTRNVDEGDPYR